MKKGIILFIFLSLLAFVDPVRGSDIETRLQILEEALKKQEETIKEQQRLIGELKAQIKTAPLAAVEDKEKPPEEQKPVKATGLFGGSFMTNPNLALVLNTYAYSSNLTTNELKNQGISGFTNEGINRRNGFNLDAAELFLYAPVDPYFNLYAIIPVTEDGATAEEAYFVTSALPKGHQLKAGKFRSGFGRLNAFHPHAWDFVDLPLPYRAFMGGEGIIEKGAQYTYLAPLPFYTLLGVEALQGDNNTLFGPDAASGAHAYTAFVKASFDVGDYSTILFGPSVMTGKTKTSTVVPGSDFSGDSTLYDLEFTYKWKPSKYHGFKLQSEYLYRDQYGYLTDTASGAATRLDRSQDGLYIQGVYLWNRWELGARYDTLNLFKDNYILGGASQNLGRRPWRASGMIDYNFTEFSLLRFQYNHDESNVAGMINHELFLQFIFSMGAHGAHAF
ncbi:MAG: hypothetical protein PHN75_00770 [Syntrophales bacterium]|nr:hypothetical protein [Syntrophales bacterium]